MGEWDISKNTWKSVLDELMECGLFRGIYDATNGGESFMYGVATVMEYIAFKAGEEILDKFVTEFADNMLKSQKKRGACPK